MPGLVPGIDVLDAQKDLDGRDRPGHDDGRGNGARQRALPRENALQA